MLRSEGACWRWCNEAALHRNPTALEKFLVRERVTSQLPTDVLFLLQSLALRSAIPHFGSSPRVGLLGSQHPLITVFLDATLTLTRRNHGNIQQHHAQVACCGTVPYKPGVRSCFGLSRSPPTVLPVHGETLPGAPAGLRRDPCQRLVAGQRPSTGSDPQARWSLGRCSS